MYPATLFGNRSYFTRGLAKRIKTNFQIDDVNNLDLDAAFFFHDRQADFEDERDEVIRTFEYDSEKLRNKHPAYFTCARWAPYHVDGTEIEIPRINEVAYQFLADRKKVTWIYKNIRSDPDSILKKLT